MNAYSDRRTRRALFGWALGLAALALTASAQATVVVDDTWPDGQRTNGAEPLDAAWWTSTTTSAIEVSTGSLGLVSGTSGRGIHGTFASQALAVDERLTVTFTFTTPTTVAGGAGIGAGFKIGLFNTAGNAALAADLTASTGSPNALYDPLPGYMMDLDVNTVDANVNFREKSPVPGSTGQLLSTTTGFVGLGNGGALYSFAPGTTYTGVLSVTRTASGLEFTGSLLQGTGPTVLSTATVTDVSPSVTTFDMLAFHANSSTFGSVATVNTADNGIDFSRITIDVSPVPEPGAAAMTLAVAGLALRRRRA